MTRRELELSRAKPSAEKEEEHAVTHGLHAALWDQIRRRLSGGARRLEVEVCHDSATVTLAGAVNSFYAKQLLYHLCGRCTPGFRVIDSTVVVSVPHRQD